MIPTVLVPNRSTVRRCPGGRCVPMRSRREASWSADRAPGFEVCLVSDGRHWGFPKGLLEAGETPEAAALREISEETGIPREDLTLRAALPVSEYVYRRPNHGALIFKRVHHFLVEAPAGTELRPDPAEIAEAGWFEIDDGAKPIELQELRRGPRCRAPRCSFRDAPRSHRRIGEACNSSTPPARRWCPSSRWTGGSVSTCAASRRTTRRTSVTPLSTTCST